MNPISIIGFVVNSIILLVMLMNPRYQPLVPFCIVFFAVSIVAYFLYLSKPYKKIGSILLIISLLPFIPFGILVFVGARKEWEKREKEDFLIQNTNK